MQQDLILNFCKDAPNHLLSNVNSYRLDQLVNLVERIDLKKPFLNSNKKLVIVERNNQCLDNFLVKLLPELISECNVKIVKPRPYLPFHVGDRMCQITEYFNSNEVEKVV